MEGRAASKIGRYNETSTHLLPVGSGLILKFVLTFPLVFFGGERRDLDTVGEDNRLVVLPAGP